MPRKSHVNPVSFRVTPDDRARWEASAEASGLNMSEWITRQCNATIASEQLGQIVREELRTLRAFFLERLTLINSPHPARPFITESAGGLAASPECVVSEFLQKKSLGKLPEKNVAKKAGGGAAGVRARMAEAGVGRGTKPTERESGETVEFENSGTGERTAVRPLSDAELAARELKGDGYEVDDGGAGVVGSGMDFGRPGDIGFVVVRQGADRAGVSGGDGLEVEAAGDRGTGDSRVPAGAGDRGVFEERPDTDADTGFAAAGRTAARMSSSTRVVPAHMKNKKRAKFCQHNFTWGACPRGCK